MSLKERLGFDKDPVFLVDGHAFIYRFFYANPDFRRSDGLPTNALFQVMRMLLTIIKDERPRWLGFFMDGKGPTFRHELFPAYKAQRPSMPEDLAAQLEPIRQAVATLGMTVIVSKGGEADDCIATLAARCKTERPVVIVGADKDLRQCLDDNVVMWDPGSRNSGKIITVDDFRNETGLSPSQWPDFQALTGDSSDNIPGAPGVGPKTAQAIMADHPSLEAIRDHLDELKPTVRKKVEPAMDDVFTYRRLTTLRTDLCDAGLDDLRCAAPSFEAVNAFMDEYEIRALQRLLPSFLKGVGDTAPEAETPESGVKDAADAAKAKKAKAHGGDQWSLLGGESPAPDDADLPEAADADALPPLEGRDVGLVVLDDSGTGGKGLAVCADKVEVRYTGPVADLAALLAGAERVATPSVKDLLRADPAWSGVPVDAWFDIGLAAYLLRPEDRSYDLDHVRRRLETHLAGLPGGMAATPGALTLDCMNVLQGLLDGAGLAELMRSLETPLIPVLARMEQAGVAIDPRAFQAFLDEVQAQLDDLDRSIRVAAGRDFNPRSSQQLAEVLFDELELKPGGKTPGGARSTSSSVLEKLKGRHEVVDLILDYRTLEKLRSTYLDPLPRLAEGDGRIHTTFNQLATATGRLSSSNPNLQNIPIRGEQGPRMRACFTAAPGMALVSADYSQIELRVLAHFSEETALVEAFNQGEDIHSRTAALVFDTAPGSVTPDQRRSAKTINFGLIYGMGPQKLARDLGLKLAEAKEFIERYFERLPGLKTFFESVHERTGAQGYVTTLAGRRRLLPDISSRNNHLQSQAKRQAVNTLIQGSAADIIKLAMLEADADAELARLEARLILQVHDELLLETPLADAGAAAKRLEAIMSGIRQLRVPLAVDTGTGANWAVAH